MGSMAVHFKVALWGGKDEAVEVLTRGFMCVRYTFSYCCSNQCL